jgi:hypothetical protein
VHWEIYKTLTKHFQALIESRRKPSNRNILEATYSIIFFGTESGGNETLRNNLLRQLREGSEFLENQKDEISYMWKKYEPKIVSFYETAPTPTMERVGFLLSIAQLNNTNFLQSDSGSFRRDGKRPEMVDAFSAQIYIPNEQRVLVKENHTNMIKFASADHPTYQAVVRYLKEWVDSIESHGTEWAFYDVSVEQEC